MNEHKIELPDGVPPLTGYYVYMTEGCNLACKHCWISPMHQARGGTGGHIEYHLLVKAIEEALPLGLSNVKLTGGEPLLHPDFILIVEFLQKMGLSLTIETNGVLMTKELAIFLKEKSSLKFVSVSIDGATPESHDAFRGVVGSFEKACRAVQSLSDVGYRPQVIMSIYAGNIDEIEALVTLAQRLGAGSVKFNLIQPSGRGETMGERDQTLELKRLIQIGHWVEKDFQKQIAIPLIYSWPMAFFSLNHLMTFSGYSCSAKNILGILGSGHFALCGIGMQEPDLIYGKISDVPVKDIWINHPRLISLREALPERLEGICGECLLRDTCMGTCVAQNYHLSKKLTAPYWFCHEANQVGLFPITRKRRDVQ